MADANIILGYRPPEVNNVNPLQQAMGLAQLQGVQDTRAKNALAVQRQNKLTELLGAGAGEDDLRRAGFLDEAASLGKGARENKKLDNETLVQGLTATGKRFELVGQLAQGINSPETWAQARATAVQSGLPPEGFGEQYDPAHIQSIRQRSVTEQQNIANKLAALTQQEAVTHNRNSEGIQVRGQNVTAATAANALEQGERKLQTVAGATGGFYTAPAVAPRGYTAGQNIVTGQMVDKDNNPINPAVKPGSAGVKEKEKVNDATDALALIDQARTLLPTATGSLIGTGYDKANAAIGRSTEGAQSAAQLKALEGMLVSKMPKMSGPQSDKDVENYKQMAAQVGDSRVPAATRARALDTVEAIQRKYAGLPPKGAASQDAPIVPAAPGQPDINSFFH